MSWTGIENPPLAPEPPAPPPSWPDGTQFWPDWLTQPVATVFTGLGALAAAAIAFTIAWLTRRQAERHFQQKRDFDERRADEQRDFAERRADEQRNAEQVRGLRDRFTTVAGQLADKSAAIQIAGVYAMEALTNEWIDRGDESEAQACIGVLCSYLRLPFTSDSGRDPEHAETVVTKREEASGEQTELKFVHRPSEAQVRQSIVAVFRQHLQSDASHSWSKFAFDFEGATFENVDFDGSVFLGTVTFNRAVFKGDYSSLWNLEFGERADFRNACFEAAASFYRSRFHRSAIFSSCSFRSTAGFGYCEFDRSADFEFAEFGRDANFAYSIFGSTASFNYAKFVGTGNFEHVDFSDKASFRRARFESKATFVDSSFAGGADFSQPRAWGEVRVDWASDRSLMPSPLEPSVWPPAVEDR